MFDSKVNSPSSGFQASKNSSLLVSTTPKINCSFFPKFTFYHPEHGFAPFNCKSWDCPTCGPVKIDRVVRDMVACSLKNNLSRHLSLTLDPEKMGSSKLRKTFEKQTIFEDLVAMGVDPWEYLDHVWNRMRARLYRRAKKQQRRLKWLKVIEIQPETGNPHFHLLLSEYVPYKWIKEAWDKSGGGSVYIRYVKIHHVRPFIKGYFTKSLGEIYPFRRRRYTSSQNKWRKAIISEGRLPKEPGWRILKEFKRPVWAVGLPDPFQLVPGFTPVGPADFVEKQNTLISKEVKPPWVV